MIETFGPSLREAIYSKIAESGGTYLLIYSGLGEKLSFLSSLERESNDSDASRLVVDLSLKQFDKKINPKGSTIIDCLPEASRSETPESYCLKIVRDEVTRFTDNRVDFERLVVVVDPSSFSWEAQESPDGGVLVFQKNLAFHNDLVSIINSAERVTAVLLYDANLLSAKLMSKLIEFHKFPGSSLCRLTPEELRDESLRRVNAGKCYPQIVVSGGDIILIDPASESAALLVPITEDIKKVLPNDPLNIAHRDVAFANNYTSRAGACPYWSADVGSGCLLDPNVIHAVDTRGRSFIEGRPCVTAVDYMVFEERPEKKEDTRSTCKQDRANRVGTLEYASGQVDTPTLSNKPLLLKHPTNNHGGKTGTDCKTDRPIP
jgi:hypothetical protein